MNQFTQHMKDKLQNPEKEYWPEVRWWLAEGLNTNETLKRNIGEINASGFGAAEFLAMPEPGADSSVYGWGSKEWTSDSQLIIREATKVGMGFSLTSGANWSNANLPDTYSWKGVPYNPDSKAALKELDYATILLEAGERFEGELPYPVKVDKNYSENIFYGVVKAKIVKERENCGKEFEYAEGNGIGVLEFDSLEDLSDLVQKNQESYCLDWKAPEDGKYALLVYWMHGTGQTAEPSSSTNYTVNYVDSYGIEALIDYWEEVVLDEELKKVIAQNGRGQFYMDSLELSTYGAGGLFWGYNLKKEFLERCGYDITPYIPILTIDGHRHEGNFHPDMIVRQDYTVADEKDLEKVEKISNDFFGVLSDMYLENVLKPLQLWLHSINMTLRSEPSYGMTYEISKPAKYLDGVEVETFAQSADIDLYRGLSGSANMYNRLYSSETGAVEGKNYFYNMDQWTQVSQLQFSEGVNRTVFHGYSAIEGSEQDTKWPGHEGMYSMFSERFSSRQPASKDYKEWTTMLARNQKILRQGSPVRDIAILRTDYFFAAYDKYHEKDELDLFPSNYMMNDRTYYWNDLSLQQAGYTYDYFSPLLLEDDTNVNWNNRYLQPDGPAYQAMIVFQETLEYSSAKKLLEIASSGIPLLFVNNNCETVRHKKQVSHKEAASRSKGYNYSNEEIQEIVKEIKKLENVRTVDKPENVLAVLENMNICPRVKFAIPNNKILTASRMDREENIFYTYLYSYKFEKNKGEATTRFTISMEGEGVPYRIDTWTNEVEAMGAYSVKDGRTYVELSLIPGEAAVVAIDQTMKKESHILMTTADGAVMHEDGVYLRADKSGVYTAVNCEGKEEEYEICVPDTIDLNHWNVTIQDWNEGEKVINRETQFGHDTVEVYFKTKKTDLNFECEKLVAWKDLPATTDQLSMLSGDGPSMSHVSGVGYYETTFELPENWEQNNGAVLWIEDAGGGTVSVTVNEQKLPIMNTRTLNEDISCFLKKGMINTLRIEVTTTLTNRMLQRGYDGWINGLPEVQKYGLQGKVQIKPYTLMKMES